MGVCKICDGKGLIEKYVERNHSNHAFIWDYAHDGYSYSIKCKECNGTGYSDMRKLTIHLDNVLRQAFATVYG